MRAEQRARCPGQKIGGKWAPTSFLKVSNPFSISQLRDMTIDVPVNMPNPVTISTLSELEEKRPDTADRIPRVVVSFLCFKLYIFDLQIHRQQTHLKSV